MRALYLRPTAFDLSTAARFLGISHQALTRELRDRGILIASGYGLVPALVHERNGNLIREQRHTLINQSILKHYVVTRVTVKGLAWLAEELRGDPARAA